jgi:hypothetical protein
MLILSLQPGISANVTLKIQHLQLIVPSFPWPGVTQYITSFITPPLRSEILEEVIISLPHLLGVRVPSNVLLRIDIETLSVAGKANGRDDGTLVSSVIDGIPVHAAEEGVGFYLGGASRDVAQAAGAVDRAELLDDVFCFGGDGGVRWEGYWLFDDSVGRRRMLVCASTGDGRGKGQEGRKTYCL